MSDASSLVRIGGHPALDFLNTVGGRSKAREVEHLSRYADVLGWSVAAGVVGPHEADRLRTLAGAAPEEAETIAAELREQRERLHRLLAALVEGLEPAPADRAKVEADLKAAHAAARLQLPRSGPEGWRVDVGEAGLRTPGHRIALVTSALLAGDAWRHVAMCEGCSWMFLDHSPSRRRRWCSMAACGNRAKAHRHYRKGS